MDEALFQEELRTRTAQSFIKATRRVLADFEPREDLWPELWSTTGLWLVGVGICILVKKVLAVPLVMAILLEVALQCRWPRQAPVIMAGYYLALFMQGLSEALSEYPQPEVTTCRLDHIAEAIMTDNPAAGQLKCYHMKMHKWRRYVCIVLLYTIFIGCFTQIVRQGAAMIVTRFARRKVRS